eukprot:TRINITY_DN2187_c1_g1_i1.p1 TRINITY_DN2187_c1_g1~~TRINITY_DN2187_c1_g1_i1.p1  ORF type:complete len:468 (+),score=56.46 TRINITY_DN2187_c1_g1_i1:46-1449(+)
MQVTIAFPDAGFPDFLFIASEGSLVNEAAEAAAEEWNTDAAFLDVLFAGRVLPPSSLLISHGLEDGSQLLVLLIQYIGKKLLRDSANKVCAMVERSGDKVLRLDTSTFANDNGCIDFRKKWIPKGVLNICFANPYPSITSVVPDFLRGLKISSVDFPGFEFVKVVGNNFFRSAVFPSSPQCSSLTPLNLSALRNVTSVGECFLADCRYLVSLDLSELSSVTSVDDNFLSCSHSLETLNLSMTSVTSIGDNFIRSCCTLKTLQLSGFGGLKKLPQRFLESCCSLKSLDLSSLNGVTSVGNDFLLGCRALSTMNLSAFSNVTSVGGCFLSDCQGLRSVDLSSLRNVTFIGGCFFYRCRSLLSLDLSALTSVTSVDDCFLFGCASLQKLDISGWDSLTNIGERQFIEGCPSLSVLNLPDLGGVPVCEQDVRQKIRLLLEHVAKRKEDPSEKKKRLFSVLESIGQGELLNW